MNIKLALRPVLVLAGLTLAGHAAAQITLYDGAGFRGRSFSTDQPVADLGRSGFNDRASSLVVGAGRWQVCDDAGFAGRCVVVLAGDYPSLRSIGLDNRISSIQPVSALDVDRDSTQGSGTDLRPVPSERLIEAPVTSVRAVMGPPEQRCWLERQQVVTPTQAGPNVPGAIVGGLLGGVLGHQVGGGVGKGVATTLGALGGGALGSHVGRGGVDVTTQDVRRCESAVSGPPRYWEVTYAFGGLTHHLQMSAPPGRTILVNQFGEPRQRG
jgi:uncharacterized protein YcfJ